MIAQYNQNYQYHKDKDLVVIWSAKAGCTIVVKMFFEQEGLSNEVSKYEWVHDFREKHSIANKSDRIQALSNPKTKYIQFVVNPYRRAVSSYIHAMRHKYLGFQYTNLSYSVFLDKLINKVLPNDIHHSSQIFKLHKEKQIEYIKMEEIQNKLPYINDKYKLEYKIKSSNHYAKKTNEDKIFLGNTEWENIKNKIPKDYSNFYNKEIKQKVEIAFSEDIALLDYDFNDLKKYNYV
jgi:hypothetical protein